MLINHHDIDQNISFLGKHFCLLVTHPYLYQKQLNQHKNKSGAQSNSIKHDKFSMVVLHPVVKRRTGLFDFWVLYSVLFFSGTAFTLTMYLAYSLLISFLV